MLKNETKLKKINEKLSEISLKLDFKNVEAKYYPVLYYKNRRGIYYKSDFHVITFNVIVENGYIEILLMASHTPLFNLSSSIENLESLKKYTECLKGIYDILAYCNNLKLELPK